MLVSVFVVGNVYAEEVKPTYGKVSEITNDNAYPRNGSNVKYSTSTGKDGESYTFDYNSATLTYIGKKDGADVDRGVEAAWLGIRIEKLTGVEGTVTLKLATKNGANFEIPEETTGLVTMPGEYGLEENQYDIWTPITLEDVQKAVVGNGTYSVVYVLTWEVTEGKTKTDYTQTITLNVKADKVTITDERESEDVTTKGEVLWNSDKATIYKMQNPVATTETEGTGSTTGTNGAQDDVPPTNDVMTMALVGTIVLGIALMLVSVFVVGNVSAKTTITAGAVTDHTTDSLATSTALKPTIAYPKGAIGDVVDHSVVNITYNAADLKLVAADKNIGRNMIASWIGIAIEEPTVSDGKEVTATLNGEEFTKDEDGYHIFTGITPDVIKEALKGNGNIARTYTIEWTATDEDDEVVATLTQTINFIVKAENITITNSGKVEGGDNLVWTKEMTKSYKASLPAATTETEGTGNATGTNGAQDDVPPTNDVMTMALVGTIVLGIALMLVSVFVVGNVYAATVTLDKMEWSKLTDLTAEDGTYEAKVSNNKYNFDGVIVNYINKSVEAEKGIGKITTKIKAPTLTWKDEEGKAYSSKSAVYTYSVNNGKEIDANSTLALTEIQLDTEITYAKLEAAAKAGKTALEDVYTISINLYENSEAKSGNPLATATFKIVVRTDITTLIFDDDSESNQDWSKQIYDLVKVTPAAPTETEETGNTTGTNGAQDDVPPTNDVMTMALVGTIVLGIALMLVSVFVVGNVSAKTTITAGAVTDHTAADSLASTALKPTIVYPGGVTDDSIDYTTVNITYNAADLKLVAANKAIGRDTIASWIGIEIAKATASDSSTITAKLNGEEFEADTDGYHIFTGITPDVIKEALKGNGNITRTYTIEWTATDDDDEVVATLTQTINLIIKAENVTVTNSANVEDGDDLVWTKSMTKSYKESLPATTETEGTGNATGTNGAQDDVPPTNDVMTMALVGTIVLGIAGAYTFKKAFNN